jgi:hypothetical protein
MHLKSMAHRLLAVAGCTALLFAAWPVVSAPAAKRPAAKKLTPVFSIPGGAFTQPVALELKAEDGIVRFTLDGSQPTADSPRYTGPLPITNCVVVRARAWAPDGTPGETASQSYLVLSTNLAAFKSTLPLVLIHSVDGEIQNETKSLCGMRIVNSLTGEVTPMNGEDFNGLALFNVRGFSSLRYPKHSFSVKVVNEFREPRKVSLLKLPKESDWVLYGPYPDKTLMRDALAYELSNAMGRWAPHTRFVEAFVNEGSGKLGMEHYAGVYLLVEKVTRDKNRVNIQKLEAGHQREPEITGGYIFKKDHAPRSARRTFGEDGPPPTRTPSQGGLPSGPGGFPADPAGFLPPDDERPRTTRTTIRSRRAQTMSTRRPRTNYVATVLPRGEKLAAGALVPDEEGFRTTLQGNQFYYDDPEPDEITAVQRAWLKEYVNAFESVLYGPDFTDATNGYRAFIDPDSFIDHHLLVEVTKNVDGFRFSTFYHKDRGQRLQMGPAWDWNLSLGNADGKQGYIPEYWLWPQLDDQQYSWFRRLFEDPDFGQRYVDRWGELRTNVFATTNVLARIDAFAKTLADPQQRNFNRWEILGREINPNHFVGDTYEEEIAWMKQWIEKRLAWIDKQFLPAPAARRMGDSIILTASAPGATIVYTLNGTDPRVADGQAAADVKRYSAPIPAGSDTVFARLNSGTRWSPPIVIKTTGR